MVSDDPSMTSTPLVLIILYIILAFVLLTIIVNIVRNLLIQ
jgi:hypothetical protein